MNNIARHFSTAVITAGSSANADSPRFAFGPFAGGAVLIAATGGCTQINWHGSLGPTDTPLKLYSGAEAVTSAVTDGIIVFPDQAFSLPYVVPVVVGGTCAMTALLKG
jgi:hypothetical protein